MSPERIAAWQAAIQARGQAITLLAVLVIAGAIVWLVWGQKTEVRRRLMLAGWWLLFLALLGLGLATQGGML